ncbi:hypothetical protein ACHAWF_013584 [Thalassiosira exigua]
MTSSSTNSTNYLVVGAGAASMAFIDTILTEQPEASLTVVDEHSAPGGHWNDAYGFVRLHAPSLVYGVASKQLEGNWLKLLLLKRTLFFNHRASKNKILAHYIAVMERWTASGRVTIELVNGHLTTCKVPSQIPPEFPIDGGLQLETPNDSYDMANNKGAVPSDKSFVVMGAGKAAMDTIVFLQQDLGIKPDNIRYIVPNQIWLAPREGGAVPEFSPRKLVECDLNVDEAALAMEKEGRFTRHDPHVPTVAKGLMPIVGKDEVELLRSVKGVVRRGRITSIARQGGNAVMSFKNGKQLVLLTSNTIFVHCTSPRPYNGKVETSVFTSDDVPNLLLLLTPPVPICMSMAALLESRFLKGKLNLDDDASLSDREVLDQLIRGYNLETGINQEGDARKLIGTLITMGMFCVLVNEDCTVAYKWLKSNRLSMLTVPGNKLQIYETFR